MPALEALKQHLDANPSDSVGLWLEDAARQKYHAGPDWQKALEMAGKVPYNREYRTFTLPEADEDTSVTPSSRGRGRAPPGAIRVQSFRQPP